MPLPPLVSSCPQSPLAQVPLGLPPVLVDLLAMEHLQLPLHPCAGLFPPQLLPLLLPPLPPLRLDLLQNPRRLPQHLREVARLQHLPRPQLVLMVQMQMRMQRLPPTLTALCHPLQRGVHPLGLL